MNPIALIKRLRTALLGIFLGPLLLVMLGLLAPLPVFAATYYCHQATGATYSISTANPTSSTTVTITPGSVTCLRNSTSNSYHGFYMFASANDSAPFTGAGYSKYFSIDASFTDPGGANGSTYTASGIVPQAYDLTDGGHYGVSQGVNTIHTGITVCTTVISTSAYEIHSYTTMPATCNPTPVGSSTGVSYDTVSPYVTSGPSFTGAIASRTVPVSFGYADAVSGVASVRVYYNNGSWNQCNSTGSASGTLNCLVPSDGTFSFGTASTDNLGNASGITGGGNMWVDITPPSVSGSVGNSASRTVGIGFSASDNYSGVYQTYAYYYNGGWVYCNSSAGGTSGTLSCTVPSDGTWTMGLQAEDNYGNYSGVSWQQAIGVDSTPPVMTSVTPSGTMYTNATSGSVSWTATDNYAGVYRYQHAYQWGTASSGSCTSPSGWNYEYLSSSPHTEGWGANTCFEFAVQAEDGYGNWGSWIYSGWIISDESAPTGTTTLSIGSAAYTNTAFNINWSISDAISGLSSTATYVWTMPSTDGNGNCTGTASGATAISYASSGSASSSFSNGTCASYETQAMDNAGNWGGATTTQWVMFDNVAPVFGSFSAPTALVQQHTLTYGFSWSGSTDNASGVASYNLQAQTAPVVSGACSTTWTNSGSVVNQTGVTYSLGSMVNAACYRMGVSPLDRAGNGGASYSYSSAILIDTAAPSAPSTPILATASDTGSSHTDGLTDITNGLVFTGTAEVNSTVTVYNGVTALGTATATSGGTYSVTTTVALTAGAYAITAKAADAAGNVSSTSASDALVIHTTCLN